MFDKLKQSVQQLQQLQRLMRDPQLQALMRHPKVQEFVESAAKQVLAAGKVLGLMARSEAEISACAKLGAKFLVWGVDSHVAYQAFRAPAEYLKSGRASFKPAGKDAS